MQIDWGSILITILPALFATMSGVYALNVQKKKDVANVKDIEATAADKLVAAAGSLSDTYKKLLQDMEEKQAELELRIAQVTDKQTKTEAELAAEKSRRLAQGRYITSLESAVDLLIEQVEKLGGDPIVRKNGKYKIVEKPEGD